MLDGDCLTTGCLRSPCSGRRRVNSHQGGDLVKLRRGADAKQVKKAPPRPISLHQNEVILMDA